MRERVPPASRESVLRMKKRRVFYILSAAMLLIPVVALGVTLLHRPAQTPSGAKGSFTLPDLLHEDQALTYPIESGPHIVNVFASWCASCAVEHTLLMELHDQYKVRMHGIVWRDSREKGKKWLEKRGNPYVTVGLDESGDAAAFLLGVTGTPETLVLDANGQILYRQRGPLTADIVREMIAPLLAR